MSYSEDFKIPDTTSIKEEIYRNMIENLQGVFVPIGTVLVFIILFVIIYACYTRRQKVIEPEKQIQTNDIPYIAMKEEKPQITQEALETLI